MKRGGLAGAVGVMFSGTFVSRILGFVRTAVLAAAIGAWGGAAASFATANTLPNTIYMLLAGGVINAVFVPQLVRATKLPDGGESYTNRLLTVAGAALLAATVVLTAASALLVRIYGGGMPTEWLPIAYTFAYWCVPQIFFYGLYTLLGQVLNAREKFGPYMWAPVLNNVVAIAGIVVYLALFGRFVEDEVTPDLFTTDRVLLLAGTATLGVVAQALILIIPLWRAGFRYRPAWGLEGMRSAGRMSGWTFAALAVGQLGYIAVSNVGVAATRHGGDIANNATYAIAFTVFMLPQSLVVVSVVTAMFTRLSQKAADRDGPGVRDDLSLAMRTVSVFTVPAALMVFTLAEPIARVIGGGQDATPLANVIMAFAVGIPWLGLWAVVQRPYYAYEDVRPLFWIQVAMAVVVAGGSLLSALVLPPRFWVVGIALSIGTSYVVGTLAGYVGLRRHLFGLDGFRVFSTHLRLLLASVPTLFVGLVARAWLLTFPGLGGAIVNGVVGGILIGATFLVCAWVLRVHEVTALTSRARRITGALTGTAATRLRIMTRRGGSAPATPAQTTGVPEVLDDALTSGMMLADRYRVDSLRPSPIPGVRAWVGRDTILERDVDVLSVSGPNAEHVLDGARRAALVTDPRLPKVLRAGEHDGTGYVVLEPLAPLTLADVLASGPLPQDVARSVVGEVAGALEVARRRGVHHLGLSPELVGLTLDGGVRVAGIGLSGPARGAAPEPDEAAAQDVSGLRALLEAAVGEESALDDALAGELRTASNVVVALAPWNAVPRAEELLAMVGADPERLSHTAGGAAIRLDLARVAAASEAELAAAEAERLLDEQAAHGEAWLPTLSPTTPPASFAQILDPTYQDAGDQGDGSSDAGEPLSEFRPEASAELASDEETAEAKQDASEVSEDLADQVREHPADTHESADTPVPSHSLATLAHDTGRAVAVPAERESDESESSEPEPDESDDQDGDGEHGDDQDGPSLEAPTGDPEATEDAPSDAGSPPESRPTSQGFGARVRGWLRTLDRVVPAEPRAPEGTPASADRLEASGAALATTGDVAEETTELASARPRRDSSQWELPVPESFSSAPEFSEVLAHAALVPESPHGLDSTVGARHIGSVSDSRASAWFAGRRELMARQRDRARAARKVRAEQTAQRKREAAERAAQIERAKESANATLITGEIPISASTQAPEARPVPFQPVAPEAAPAAPVSAVAEPASRPLPRPVAPTPGRARATGAPTRQTSAPHEVHERASEQHAEPGATAPARPERDQAARDSESFHVPERRPRTWGTVNATPWVLLIVLLGLLWVCWLAISSLVSASRVDGAGLLAPEVSIAVGHVGMLLT